jgi:RNA polymerase sigma-70 factor, ECF subfamily
MAGSGKRRTARDGGQMSDPFKDQVIALIPPLRGYAMSLTGSSSDADDLVQDALMRAWRSRECFQLGTNLKAWLFKIVRNTFYTNMVKRRHTVQDVEGKMAARLACTPEQEWRLQYGELLNAMDRLTPEAREALLLVVASGLSYEEAAAVCGCAVGTLKSRVNRARERLAKLVDHDLPPAAPVAPAPLSRAIYA